jgi:excisionase family DNA binding protein
MSAFAMPREPREPRSNRPSSGDVLSQMIESACEAAMKRVLNISDASQRRLLTVADAAVYLSLSEREIYNMIGTGELKGVRHGRRVMIDIRDLEAWIDANKTSEE